MSKEDLSVIFSALGDGTRFQLFKLLANKESICVSELAKELDITPACASQHLKILSDASLVTRTRAGKRVCYKVKLDSARHRALNDIIFK